MNKPTICPAKTAPFNVKNKDSSYYLKLAFRINGGLVAVARELNLTPAAVSNWYKRGIPVKYVRRVCELTEYMVTPQQLRPDIFEENGKRKNR